MRCALLKGDTGSMVARRDGGGEPEHEVSVAHADDFVPLMHSVRVNRTAQRLRCLTAVLVVLSSGACVDSPTASSASAPAAASDPLALTFDALAAASATNGDLARREGFEMAALAVRSGITPSQMSIRVGTGETESMDALVAYVDWASSIAVAQRPPVRRSLVAWRRNGSGVLRVVSVLTPVDSAAVANPLSLGVEVNSDAVYAAASAQYQDVPSQANATPAAVALWYAVTGWVKIRQLQSTGGCPVLASTSSVGGFTCSTARFSVAFDVVAQAMAGLPLKLVSQATTAVKTPQESTIDGEHFVFSCTAPKADRGCK